jgi:type II secretory pathway pseudopilin PulG
MAIDHYQSKSPSFKLISAVIIKLPGVKSNQSNGFTIVEIIIAAVLFLIVLAGIVPSFLRSINVSNKQAIRDALDAAIATDLGWIRDSSKLWYCQSGPYPAPPTGTKFGCVSSSSALNYMPAISNVTGSAYLTFKGFCNSSSLASQFISEGNASAMATNRPNPLQTASISLSMSGAPSIAAGAVINRTITIGDGNRLDILYSTPNGAAVPISRDSSVYIEAASWCP